MRWFIKKPFKFPLSFYIHTQDRGAWGFGYIRDGCRMFFFWNGYEWKNLSESHPSTRCNNDAYCRWHGAL